MPVRSLEKIGFYRSLQQAASAGLSASRAMEVLIEECEPDSASLKPILFRALGSCAGCETPPFRVALPTLRDLAAELRAGVLLSDALARHPDEFQAWEPAILKVGERSGRLDEAFGDLAGILDRHRETLLRLAAKSAGPILIQGLIPWIVLAPLAYFAGFFVYLGLASAAFLLLTPVGPFLFSRRPRGEFHPRGMPGFSKMQFSRCLGALLAAGVGADEAVASAARAAGCGAQEPGAPGEPLQARLVRCGVFSSEELAGLRIAEDCGRLDEELGRLAAGARRAFEAAAR